MSVLADALRAQAWATGAEESPLEDRTADRWEDKLLAQQIHGLVDQLFFANRDPEVRQVAFCAAAQTATTGWLCREVARNLASQSRANVYLFETQLECSDTYGRTCEESDAVRDSASLRKSSRQIFPRVWSNATERLTTNDNRGSELLASLGREQDYVVVHLPAYQANAAVVGSRLDGTVLVIEAHSTRRIVAQRLKQWLTTVNMRLLGVVLTERTFPIPEFLYRRV